MTKVCTKCKAVKPLDAFYKATRLPLGVTSWCRDCTKESQREYQKRPEVRERMNEWSRKNRVVTDEQKLAWRLWTWHRLRPEVYEAILAAQRGVCAICKSEEPGGQGRWHVDHDHSCCAGSRSCGKCVRGLLCSRCNPMIGMAKDDAARLRAASDYVESWQLLRTGRACQP